MTPMVSLDNVTKFVSSWPHWSLLTGSLFWQWPLKLSPFTPPGLLIFFLAKHVNPFLCPFLLCKPVWNLSLRVRRSWVIWGPLYFNMKHLEVTQTDKWFVITGTGKNRKRKYGSDMLICCDGYLCVVFRTVHLLQRQVPEWVLHFKSI